MRIKKSISNFIFPMLIGLIAREVVVFVNAEGLAADHILSRSLFILIFTTVAIVALWMNGEVEEVRTRIECRVRVRGQKRQHEILNNLDVEENN